MATGKAVPRSVFAAAVLACTAAFGAFFEGTRYTAYQDVRGIWTICDGHTSGVKAGDKATPAQCQAYLQRDMGTAFAAVQKCITRPLGIGPLAAFTDATYNIGPAVVCGSTLQKKANAGDVTGACNELLRWNHAGNKEVAGLTARRQAEQKLCLGEQP